MSTNVLTKEGLQKIEEELLYLKSVKRNEIAEKIKVAREFGDLSENSEYDAAREAQREMEARILQLEEQIKTATVIDVASLKGDKVSVGTKVTVYDEDFDEEIVYEIVGRNEAEPENNKVSDQSPIGMALIGKKKGNVVSVESPGGEYKLKIVKIALAQD
jgi:transcription elongation factor GreA